MARTGFLAFAAALAVVARRARLRRFELWLDDAHDTQLMLPALRHVGFGLTRVARLRGRQRQTGSLCLRTRAPLRAIIRWSQGTRLGPYFTPQTFELTRADGDGMSSAQREYEDGQRLFAHFEGVFSEAELQGRDILDLGCGYGGRTLYYAERSAGSRVTGVEISEAMVQRCRRFAENHRAETTTFRVAFAEALPFDDCTFDLIISFDVLEHVEDPVRTFHEIARSLRPGGLALLVFPSYLGARAAHLDYLTQVPGLHRIFDPDTIVEVVNEFLLAEPKRYGVKRQPPPRVGSLGRRALPTVNGMSRAEALAIVERTGLETLHSRAEPLLTANAPVPGARLLMAMLEHWARWGRYPELLIGHNVLYLRRPA